MIQDNKLIGSKPPVPGFAPEIGGSPVSVAGGNDGRDKTLKTGVTRPDGVHAAAGSYDASTDAGKGQQLSDAVAGTDRQIKTIRDWMDAEDIRPETEEERKERERKEKSKRIIASVSDGISALSNLYFTSQYAPNMYNHGKDSMANVVDARLERLKAEREKNADKYLQFSLKLGDLENQRAATLRELEAEQERQRLARERAKRDAEKHGWEALLQPDIQREQKGKADTAEQKARTAGAEADAAPEMQRAKLATERARKGSLDASASNSRASAAAHGRSHVKEFSAWDEYGNEHRFSTQAAADAYAKQHGTWEDVDEKETTTTESRRTPQSKPQKRTSTKVKIGGHPMKPASNDNTPPSRRNNNDNTPPSRR